MYPINYNFSNTFTSVYQYQDPDGNQEKNGGVKGRDMSADELDRQTGEEQITVGRTRRKDSG